MMLLVCRHVSAERARAEHERHAQEAAEEEALRAVCWMCGARMHAIMEITGI